MRPLRLPWPRSWPAPSAGRSPIAAVRLLAGRLMALLVGAIRRGARMALAMETRGFGAMPCRSVARPQVLPYFSFRDPKPAVAKGWNTFQTRVLKRRGIRSGLPALAN